MKSGPAKTGPAVLLAMAMICTLFEGNIHLRGYVVGKKNMMYLVTYIQQLLL